MEDAWVFRRALSSSRLVFDRKIVVYPSDQPQGGKILIQNPQALQWTQENHRLFPGLFKERTRLLLLYHKFYSKRSTKANSSSENGQSALFPSFDKGASETYTGSTEMGTSTTVDEDEEFPRRMIELPGDILVQIIGFMAPAIMDVEIPQPSSSQISHAP
eukprot:TRINITY_DN4837_c0_g1_i5.p1 TRINITY_DN4837_c0_g1~~TRINITY_DN4837_c0_g1_i5.p1  ORF type:complete len:160 (-),score=27.60 TRINITY_DN4837_c0_g1_i5:336-815(-)